MEEEFWVKPKGRKTGLCASCKRRYKQEWYRKNKKKHLRDVGANNLRYATKINDLVNSYKTYPCMDCKNTFPPFVMDFDHRNPLEKIFNVSRMRSRRMAMEAIKAEIKKCDVVCSNCHRIREHERRSIPVAE